MHKANHIYRRQEPIIFNVERPSEETEEYEYTPEELVEYNECQYMEELKSTIIAIRKGAKERNEAREITKDKIRAVREHDRSHGNVTTYVGETGTHFVLIKKYHT